MFYRRRRIPKHQLIEDKPSFSGGYTGRLTLLFTLIALVCIFAAANAQAIVPKTEVGSGQMELRLEGDESNSDTGMAAPLLNSRVEFTITGLVVSARLTQTFSNPSEQWVEGVYLFPLPENSAVSAMEMRIGERVISGVIRERQQAQIEYQQAKSSGKRAALIEQQRPNLFTQSVANIGPGETISVTLEYQHNADYDDGRFSFRFPMTLTPRFIAGTSKSTGTIEQDINATPDWADAARISPPFFTTKKVTSHQMMLSVNLDAGIPIAQIDSPYHDLSIVKQGRNHQITTRSVTVAMDRDFVLRWRPATSAQPTAASFSERHADGSDYALLMLLPPQQSKPRQSLPRDVQFIIDTSGSMGGTSIEQARQGLLYGLQRLRPQDQFNIIEFNSTLRLLFPQSVAATDDHLRHAQAFVQQLRAGGGTVMAPALAAALTAPAPEQYLKQTVFITDGSVGNEQQLFSAIKTQLGASRLFTVGIGSAPNSYFMRKAAQIGRGTFTHIGKQAEVAEKMAQLFDKIERPIMRDIQLHWPDAVHVESWPRKIPDLYTGEPLLVHARFTEPLPVNTAIAVTGQVNGQPWRQQINLNAPQPNTATLGIAKLWARAKIENLLDQRLLSKDEQSIRSDVLKVALTHQLMSPYTSFSRRRATAVSPIHAIRQPAQNSQSAASRTNQLPTHRDHSQIAALARTDQFTWWVAIALLAP